MATRREKVYYELTAIDNASRVFKTVEGSAQRLGFAYTSLRSAVTLLASGAFVNSLVLAAKQGEQSQARLTAALLATGERIGITRGELNELADAMALSTQFDDDSLRNAQGQLVKFGNIHGQVFRDALKASADLAAFMGTDVPSAAQLVGKALQSPTEGLTALERQFGKLTDAEEKNIKTLVEQGRAVEAQNAVLDILQKKIGGTAEIMNTGYTKATSDLGKAWDDMLEAIGRAPAVQDAASRGFGVLTEQMRAMKRVVEDGNWVELVFGSWAARAMTPSKPMNVATGRILNPAWAEQEAFEAGLAGTPAVPITLGGRTSDKDAAAAAKLAADRQLQQDVQAAGRSQLAADREAEFLNNMDEALKRQAERISLTHDEQQQVDQLAQKYQMLADREAEFSDPGKLETMLDSLKKVDAAAVDLGWAFASAFETAVIEGKNASAVVRGLGQDIARIALRQRVTQPMANAISGALSGIFGGGGGSMAGAAVTGVPAYASGTDYVPRTGLALVHQGERITPAGQNGGGVTVNQTIIFSANTPAASRDAVYAAAPVLIEGTKRAVIDAMRRGQI